MMWFVISAPFWFLAALFFCSGIYAICREQEPTKPNSKLYPVVGFVYLPMSAGICFIAARICGLV